MSENLITFLSIKLALLIDKSLTGYYAILYYVMFHTAVIHFMEFLT